MAEPPNVEAYWEKFRQPSTWHEPLWMVLRNWGIPQGPQGEADN